MYFSVLFPPAPSFTFSSPSRGWNPENASVFPRLPLTDYKGKGKGLWQANLPAADTKPLYI